MYYLIDQMAVGRLTAAPALSNEEPFQCTRQCIDCTDVCNTSKVGRSRDAGVLSCPKRREVRFEIRASSRAGQTGKIPHLSLRGACFYIPAFPGIKPENPNPGVSGSTVQNWTSHSVECDARICGSTCNPALTMQATESVFSTAR